MAYVDAPADRYVWAPSESRRLELAPIDPQLSAVPPDAPLVTDSDARFFVVAEPDDFTVPPEERLLTA